MNGRLKSLVNLGVYTPTIIELIHTKVCLVWDDEEVIRVTVK